MILSCDNTEEYIFVEGCTYSSACNYNVNAEVNDGSCLYNDCFDECGGDAIFDECNICGGDNSTCSDCDGVANGNSYLDCCGNCDMNFTNDCLLIEDSCIYNVEIFVCELEYVGLNEVIFTVCADSPDNNISGFQFSLNAPSFNITEVLLGDSATGAGMENYDTSGLSVLAFSLSSNFISNGSNLKLALFRGTYTSPEGLVQIIPSYGTNGSLSIAGSNAEELSILANPQDWSEIPIN